MVGVVFGGVLTGPERTNHMPMCWDPAGNQMGQYYDGVLIN